MPGNIVSINDWAEFYVGDSKMDKVISCLMGYGLPENKAAKGLLKTEVEPLEYKYTTRRQPSNHVKLVRPKITAQKQ